LHPHSSHTLQTHTDSTHTMKMRLAASARSLLPRRAVGSSSSSASSSSSHYHRHQRANHSSSSSSGGSSCKNRWRNNNVELVGANHRMFSDDATASVSQQADADSAAGILESEIPSIIRRSNREKLLRLLPQFSHVMTVSNREWTASEISTCLHGLRVCTMHDKDALSFLVAIARKSSQLRATKFNTTHVALSLIGMQHLEANSKVVAVMMRFLANNYEPAPNARPNLAAILLALQSLQTKMNSSADTDRLLALLTAELQSNREVMTGVEISRAFDVIKRSTNKRSRTVHGFLAVLVEKLEKAKQLLNFSPSTLTYIFNSLQDLRVSDFPELKKLLKLLVPYIPVAHCAEAFQTKHLGLSLFGLRQMSSGNYLAWT
jgi:hypothetical protein